MTPRTMLALLATGTTLRHAPVNDDRFEFWGLPYHWGKLPRLDQVFEIHEPDVIRAEHGWQTLQRIGVPIVMQREWEDLPTSRAFPYDDAAARFKPACRDKLFTGNSVAYMLALALLEAPRWKEIHLYGVDMQQGSEYEHQLRSVEFFLGVAIGAGIAVHFPPVSELLKLRFLYGYQDGARREALGDLRERVAYFRMQRDNAAANEDADRALRLKFDALIADGELSLKRAGM